MARHSTKVKRISLRGKDFLSIDDLSIREITALFERTDDMKKRRNSYRSALGGKILALIFEKPSLRTRTTFAVGIKQLGGDSLFLGPSEINLGKRESVYDVSKNLERMVDGIMIRTFGHDVCASMAEYASIPVINGLTDHEHPCQALADFYTIRQFKKKLGKLKVSYIGDGNNVAHSLLLTAGKLGVHMVVASPDGYMPQPSVVDRARELADGQASVTVTHDPVEAARDADVIYTDTWASMGQESEAEARRAVFRPYQVNRELFSRAKPDALFMHCLPAHRGEEVTDEIIDSKNSVVFDEAENRLHVQKAVMYELLRD